MAAIKGAMTSLPASQKIFLPTEEPENNRINFRDSLKFFQEQLVINGTNFPAPSPGKSSNDSLRKAGSRSFKENSLEKSSKIPKNGHSLNDDVHSVRGCKIDIPTVDTILESVRVLRAIQKSQEERGSTWSLDIALKSNLETDFNLTEEWIRKADVNRNVNADEEFNKETVDGTKSTMVVNHHAQIDSEMNGTECGKVEQTNDSQYDGTCLNVGNEACPFWPSSALVNDNNLKKENVITELPPIDEIKTSYCPDSEASNSNYKNSGKLEKKNLAKDNATSFLSKTDSKSPRDQNDRQNLRENETNSFYDYTPDSLRSLCKKFLSYWYSNKTNKSKENPEESNTDEILEIETYEDTDAQKHDAFLLNESLLEDSCLPNDSSSIKMEPNDCDSGVGTQRSVSSLSPNIPSHAQKDSWSDSCSSHYASAECSPYHSLNNVFESSVELSLPGETKVVESSEILPNSREWEYPQIKGKEEQSSENPALQSDAQHSDFHGEPLYAENDSSQILLLTDSESPFENAELDTEISYCSFVTSATIENPCTRAEAGFEECTRAEAGFEECTRAEAGSEECTRAQAGFEECTRDQAGFEECTRAQAGFEECTRTEASFEECTRAEASFEEPTIVPDVCDNFQSETGKVNGHELVTLSEQATNVKTVELPVSNTSEKNEVEDDLSDLVRPQRFTAASCDLAIIVESLYTTKGNSGYQTFLPTDAPEEKFEETLFILSKGSFCGHPEDNYLVIIEDSVLYITKDSQVICCLNVKYAEISNDTENFLKLDNRMGRCLFIKCDSEDLKSKLQFHCSKFWKTDCLQLVHYPLKYHQNVVIIDLGSCSTRAGILMDQPTLPSIFFPTVCATDKSSGHCVYGMEALQSEVRQRSNLSFPIRPTNKITKHTVDTKMLEGLFKKIFYDLKIDPTEYIVQVCLPRNLSINTQTALVKLLLEDLKVKAVSMTNQALLTLYAYDVSTAVVVDIGDRTDVLPVVDGFIVENGVTQLPYGGQRLIHHMKHGLAEKRISLSNDIDSFVVQYITENLAYVADDYENETQISLQYPDIIRKTLALQPAVSENQAHKNITLEEARFKIPEGLFNPDLWGLDCPGIHHLVQKAIQATSVDARRQVAENIYVSGGVTMLPGFVERLSKEVAKLSKTNIVPKVHASNYRYHCTYIGACKFAKMDVFSQVCISLEEYSKNSAHALKKCALYF